RVAVEVPGRALFPDVGDGFPAAVREAAREIVPERLPGSRTGVPGELAQPGPALPPRSAQLVERENLPVGTVFDREFPSLAFEDDPEDLDSPVGAMPDEFRVVDEAVHPEPLRDLTVGFVLEIGERDRPAAERGPHEHRGPHLGEVIDHPQPTGWEAGVIVVLAGVPAVEVDAALHGFPVVIRT